MLPTVLSDSLCSLQEKEDRFAFVCDMMFEDGTLVETTFRHAHIRVMKNYRYEEPSLLSFLNYQHLFQLTQQLDRHVKDSHDVVAFWMIETNSRIAEHFAQHSIGIFRSVVFQPYESNIPTFVSDDCRRTIQLWNTHTSGQYVLFHHQHLQHDALKRDKYVHATSPIRRLVDLLNQMIFFSHFLKIQWSDAGQEFLKTWISKLNDINISMRLIRKVQNDCHMIHQCHHDPDILQQIHDGIVFERVERESGYYNYMVYLETLKLLTRVRTTKLFPNYTRVDCKLLVFENEEKTKRKIRIVCI